MNWEVWSPKDKWLSLPEEPVPVLPSGREQALLRVFSCGRIRHQEQVCVPLVWALSLPIQMPRESLALGLCMCICEMGIKAPTLPGHMRLQMGSRASRCPSSARPSLPRAGLKEALVWPMVWTQASHHPRPCIQFS